MQAVGRHYGKHVKLYSIWNEPNQPQYLRPQYVHGQLASPALYRSLFLAGYAGLKASGQLLRHEGADGRDLADRRAERRDPGAAGVPARRAVPGLRATGRSATARSCRPTATRSTPTRRAPGRSGSRATQDRRRRRRHDRHARPPRHGARPRRGRRRDPPRTCRSTSPSSASRASPTTCSASRSRSRPSSRRSREKIAWSNPRVVVLRPVPAARRPAQGARLPVRPRDLQGRARSPCYGGFRAAARRDAHAHRRLVLGSRAAARAARRRAPPTGSTGATGPTGTTGPTGATGSTGRDRADRHDRATSGGRRRPSAVDAAPRRASVGRRRASTVQYSNDGGKTWRTLLSVRTDSRGAWSASGHFARAPAVARRWVSPPGDVYYGAPTRAYTTSGQRRLGRRTPSARSRVPTGVGAYP